MPHFKWQTVRHIAKPQTEAQILFTIDLQYFVINSNDVRLQFDAREEKKINVRISSDSHGQMEKIEQY